MNKRNKTVFVASNGTYLSHTDVYMYKYIYINEFAACEKKKIPKYSTGKETITYKLTNKFRCFVILKKKRCKEITVRLYSEFGIFCVSLVCETKRCCKDCVARIKYCVSNDINTYMYNINKPQKKSCDSIDRCMMIGHSRSISS